MTITMKLPVNYRREAYCRATFATALDSFQRSAPNCIRLTCSYTIYTYRLLQQYPILIIATNIATYIRLRLPLPLPLPLSLPVFYYLLKCHCQRCRVKCY